MPKSISCTWSICYPLLEYQSSLYHCLASTIRRPLMSCTCNFLYCVATFYGLAAQASATHCATASADACFKYPYGVKVALSALYNHWMLKPAPSVLWVSFFSTDSVRCPQNCIKDKHSLVAQKDIKPTTPSFPYPDHHKFFSHPTLYLAMDDISYWKNFWAVSFSSARHGRAISDHQWCTVA